MEKIITKVAFVPAIPTLKRVAAYARVSSDKDAMHHSLAAQVSHYSQYIQGHHGWQYAGVFADEGLTGTKSERKEFQRLLADCRAGKIDIVLCKSLSRFARNTVTLIQTLRELRSIGIEVIFEDGRLTNMDVAGELLITLLAAQAQEESRDISDSCKWGIRGRFEEGIPTWARCYGYETIDGKLHTLPKEAAIVQMIFAWALDGWGSQRIANALNERGIPAREGGTWSRTPVQYILSNERYIGDLLLQKSFVKDHLTKKKCVNRGDLPQFHVADDHAPLVSHEDFDRVQSLLEERREKYRSNAHGVNLYAFTGMIRCGNCGANYRRKMVRSVGDAKQPVWICATFNTRGKKVCASKQIPEATLMETAAKVLKLPYFDSDIFIDLVDHIETTGANTLRFFLNDGSTRDAAWQDRSRAKSWTPEMRQKAAQRSRETWQTKEK